MADEGVDPVVWSLPPSECSFMGTLMTVQDGPWNDQCSHTVRKTVLVSVGETPANDTEVDTGTSSVNDDVLAACGNPWTTDTDWALDLGAAHTGMVLVAFDLNGRQLCAPAYPDANGRIHVEADQWPSLVLLRLIHEPTMGVKTWKMVR